MRTCAVVIEAIFFFFFLLVTMLTDVLWDWVTWKPLIFYFGQMENWWFLGVLMFGSFRVCVPVNFFFFCFLFCFCLFISVLCYVFEYVYFLHSICLFTCMCMLLCHLRVAWVLSAIKFCSVLIEYTVDSRYLELEETLWNTSRYPYFDISDLQNWGKYQSINQISQMSM